MKRLHVGDKVRIKDSNNSAIKVGSVHTITEKWHSWEHGETVWRIGTWLFLRSQLEFVEQEGEER